MTRVLDLPLSLAFRTSLSPWPLGAYGVDGVRGSSASPKGGGERRGKRGCRENVGQDDIALATKGGGVWR